MINFIRDILKKVFPNSSNSESKGQYKLLCTVINSLPDDFEILRQQVRIMAFNGFGKWELLPDHRFVQKKFPDNSENYYRQPGVNYRISGIQIFSKLNKKYVNVDLLVRNNILTGIKIWNCIYSSWSFDLKKVKAEKVTRTVFQFPQNGVEKFLDNLDAEMRSIISPDELNRLKFNDRDTGS